MSSPRHQPTGEATDGSCHVCSEEDACGKMGPPPGAVCVHSVWYGGKVSLLAGNMVRERERGPPENAMRQEVSRNRERIFHMSYPGWHSG